METNKWYQDEEGFWHYHDADGKEVSGWKKIGGKWYYFDYPDNIMLSDDVYDINGNYYCFDKSGAMVTGWFYYDKEDFKAWIHLAASGALDRAKWLGDYYVDEQGVMVTSSYIKNGDKYYWVNKDGKYTKTYSEAEKGYYVYDQATGCIIAWPEAAK